MLTTNKQHINRLLSILEQAGINDYVISPGSRNAPLVIALASRKGVNCYSVVDERSAGFYALGMAIQTGKPCAVVCTSGSAVLNYAPAVAEAYYQKVPLLVLSADRPRNMVDIGDSQTINQEGVFRNFCRKSFQLNEEPLSQDDLIHNRRMISEACSLLSSSSPEPVHINIPLVEPLYVESHDAESDFLIRKHLLVPCLSSSQKELFKKQWETSTKRMIIVGQMNKPSEELNKTLERLSLEQDTVVLTETTSNVHSDTFVSCIDRTITGMTDTDKNQLAPNLLIYIGGAIVSKKIKAYLRESSPTYSWFVNESGEFMDTFLNLTDVIPCEATGFLSSFIESPIKSAGYSGLWKNLSDKKSMEKADFLNSAPYSDLKVFEFLLKNLPQGANLHVANSSPIRYVQLFDAENTYHYYSNRGVSGIDGSLSTAVGFSLKNKGQNFFITGDLSLLYDSNGLLYQSLPNNLKIIAINNGGGGIFDIISGSGNTHCLDNFIATRHERGFSDLAAMYQLNYFSADSLTSLKECFEKFLAVQQVSILEIKTDARLSADILKKYFADKI
jgi:2-succinyl-5-enolpyruvyl-6-hydroxy-3-cyclohexene-1-carboxylate synthase